MGFLANRFVFMEIMGWLWPVENLAFVFNKIMGPIFIFNIFFCIGSVGIVDWLESAPSLAQGASSSAALANLAPVLGTVQIIS
jgi:hypothetical protein